MKRIFIANPDVIPECRCRVSIQQTVNHFFYGPPTKTFGGDEVKKCFAGFMKKGLLTQILRNCSIWVCALALCPAISHAVGSTASFLKVGVGARAGAMGGAYTAVADELTAIYWNPAGLAEIKKTEIGAMHASLYNEARYNFIGGAHALGGGVGAIGLNYLDYLTLEGRDINRNLTGDFGASDLAFNIGYGQMIGEGLAAGANIKYIRSKIENESATGAALDLGAQYKLNSLPLDFGLALQNIGPKMKFIEARESLPFTIAFGAAYKPKESVILAADYKQRPNDADNEFGIGAEYKLNALFALRAGYNTKSANPNKSGKSGGTKSLDNLLGLSAGVGINIASLQVDYSFTPSGELGNTQRIYISAKF